MTHAPYEDFVQKAMQEYKRYVVKIALSPDRMQKADAIVKSLDWSFIPYGSANIHEIPDHRRGVYAFVVSLDSKALPPHHYVMYIGIAGRNSTRSLRERYTDYKNNKKNILNRRPGIAAMFANWESVLQFHFATVDNTVTTEELTNIEKTLNNALMPPYSLGDMDAELKRMRRAFS